MSRIINMSFLNISCRQCYCAVFFVFITTVTDGLSASETERFENLLNAVVRIDVLETTFTAGAKRSIRGVGSGVIMSAEGHILTNAHVIENSDSVKIALSTGGLISQQGIFLEIICSL